MVKECDHCMVRNFDAVQISEKIKYLEKLTNFLLRESKYRTVCPVFGPQ